EEGGFGCVLFYYGVVNAASHQGAQDMFDGMDGGLGGAKCCAAVEFVLSEMFVIDGDYGGALKICPPELKPGTAGGGVECHFAGDAGMYAFTVKGYGL